MFSNDGSPDELELRRLYDAAAPMLVRVAYRIAGTEEAAEDIVHEAFIRLLEKRLPFATLDDAKFWLIRVVKNGALNYAKRKGREARAYERWWRGERAESEAADADILRGESEAEVKLLLERLPEKLKSVLVLKEYGGMSYKEIGRTLGITEGNVKVRAFRAREALLAMIDEEAKHVP
ncbi:MAG TPA: RNA polymerase sigma factor [Spirochaetia bacterium]|nr:RNA polymerase sigma factor [Spirochaetales bacterium]HRY72199.1 RNA polymerase sigma factor [Spirochaetia bacterium]